MKCRLTFHSREELIVVESFQLVLKLDDKISENAQLFPLFYHKLLNLQSCLIASAESL